MAMTVSLDQPGMGIDAPLRDAVAGVIRHAGDVARLLQGDQPRWTDALLSEVRAHLSGCLNAVELSIGLAIGDNWLARPTEALGPGYCRTAIERHPSLLSPLLLGHLRQRGAAALSLRMAPLVLSPAAPEEHSDPATVDALTALRLSVDPWSMPHPLERPMRADLAAEAYCELVWTAAALLVEGLTSRMGVDPATAGVVIGRAAQSVIARHDEQAGPFSRAAFAATLVQDESEVTRLAGDAALRHDLLLLAALGGKQAGIPLHRALTLLIDGAHEDRAALARLLGLSDAAYVTLLDGLSPVLEAAVDWPIAELMTRYTVLTPTQAAERLARWRGPAPLVDRLAKIGIGDTPGSDWSGTPVG